MKELSEQLKQDDKTIYFGKVFIGYSKKAKALETKLRRLETNYRRQAARKKVMRLKLSEQLKQDHESGDFGEALEGYSARAKALETRLLLLENKIIQEDKGITELRLLKIVDACFHAYASDYRVAAQILTKRLLEQQANNGD